MACWSFHKPRLINQKIITNQNTTLENVENKNALHTLCSPNIPGHLGIIHIADSIHKLSTECRWQITTANNGTASLIHPFIMIKPTQESVPTLYVQAGEIYSVTQSDFNFNFTCATSGQTNTRQTRHNA